MAKISFTKLGLKLNQEIKTIEYNGQNIEVKQYLPIQDKLKLIGDVIMKSAEQDTNFANPIKANIYKIFGIIENYTNINFTEKQKEDVAKLYDLLKGSGMIDRIFEQIPEMELKAIDEGVEVMIKSFYDYKNSIVGVLDTVSKDYSNTTFDVNAIMNKLQNSQDLDFLKEIAPLLNTSGLND